MAAAAGIFRSPRWRATLARRCVRFVALVLVLPTGGPAAVTAAEPPTAQRPVYATGQRWIRSDGVFELIRIEDGRYVFVGMGRQEVHLTKDLAVARTVRGERFNEIDPPVPLKWPLKVGAWGIQSSIWRWTDNPTGVPAKLTWRVASFEEVTVPAGTFKAFRVDMNVELSPAWNKTYTAWYAPSVKQYVKGGPGGMFQWDLFNVLLVDPPSPLRVVLTAPAEAARLNTGETRLTGTASGEGLARVEVTVNGRVAAQLRAARAEPITLDVPLALAAGPNTIVVTAIDAAGERQQESRTVHRHVDKPVEKLPAAVSPAPAVPPARPPLALAPPPAGGPPTLALQSPAHRSRVEQDTVTLAGIASADRGVARVLVSLNGVDVARQEETPPRPAVPISVPLKLREGQNTIVVTVADAAGALQQEVRAVEYDRPVPLSISVRYPEDRSRTPDATSVVAAVVESGRGVREVQVLLNGAVVHRESPRPGERSVVVTAPVTLQAGPNTIVVRATQPDDSVRQELRTVIHEPPTRVAAVAERPVAPPPPVRNQWAVVIGVGQYQSPQIPRLRYAVSDAEAIHQALIGPVGFKKDNVLLLTDRTERKPTLRNIKWALGTFLGRSAQKDDTVLIFFAGHGAPEPDTRGLERDGLAKYLIPSDADPDDLFSTALPMDDLQTIFGRIEAERVVAFLDACYSGAAGGRTFAAQRTRAGAAVDDLFLERLTRSKGRAIVTASRPAEVSLELTELGHGIFTYYLINGLRGAADLNRDGIVSLQELYEYVEQQVTTKSRAVGGSQHPVMKGEMEGALPLVRVRAP